MKSSLATGEAAGRPRAAPIATVAVRPARRAAPAAAAPGARPSSSEQPFARTRDRPGVPARPARSAPAPARCCLHGRPRRADRRPSSCAESSMPPPDRRPPSMREHRRAPGDAQAVALEAEPARPRFRWRRRRSLASSSPRRSASASSRRPLARAPRSKAKTSVSALERSAPPCCSSGAGHGNAAKPEQRLAQVGRTRAWLAARARAARRASARQHPRCASAPGTTSSCERSTGRGERGAAIVERRCAEQPERRRHGHAFRAGGAERSCNAPQAKLRSTGGARRPGLAQRTHDLETGDRTAARRCAVRQA